MTLACENGEQMEAHKVILAASSPFFENILRRKKHSHPLIYFQSQDLLNILDFGKTNVYQGSLDSFFAIAEELKLKALTGQTTSVLMKEEVEPLIPKPDKKTVKLFANRESFRNAPVPNAASVELSPIKLVATYKHWMRG